MSIRSRFAFLALSPILVVAACSGSSADNSPLISTAFGATSDANTVTGSMTLLTGSCPTLTFALERRTVKTDGSTSFDDAGCVALKNGVRVEVAGTTQSDGTLKASRVRVVVGASPLPPPPAPPTIVSVSGIAASLAGACPTISFTLENRLIKADVATAFGGGGCAGVKNGVRIEIAGNLQTDGSIKALKVGIVTVVAPPPAPVPTTTISVSGAVKNLSGICPTIGFTLENRSIKTNASTAFGNGGCTSIKNDVRVEITGNVQADNSVLALKAGAIPTTTTQPPPVVPPPAPTVTSISGNISALTGACPQLIIAIGERKATTGAATAFEVRACGELAVGSYVEIVGLAASTSAATALAATKVTGRK
ncbi:MAG: DUF5666 domain-containing protein [Gemmatimonadaceae bacterium]